jgi:hypothetical protein
MNYKKIYDSLISRGVTRIITGYSEKHHIIPRCIGGTNESSNLVSLTPEEHFVAHQLLVKIYPGEDKLVFALVIMSGKNPTTNRLFGWHRRKLADAQRKAKTGKKMPPRDPEHTRKIAEANTGKKHTQETKDQISRTKMGTEPWNKGKKSLTEPWNKGTIGVCVAWNKGQKMMPQTEERKQKTSEAMKASYQRRKAKNEFNQESCCGDLQSTHSSGSN